ncbi:fimbrial protein [Serratia sp. DD3]|uniref:fimbrial protein n=1 Tax=Serratia sp. DD3 TaxID=1410619 RepID=UPI0003C52473|nr:type 1 fimbrial protein [Serratia sp. DD3]KEY60285.1 putative fimbrial protein SthA [Serratia sp. DD3]
MNKLTMIASSLLLSAAAQANNTINFQGEVAGQSCAVSINGNASAPLILLPTVSSASLGSVGSTAGQTAFTIGLTGCTASGTEQTIDTVFVGNNLNAAKRLTNTGSVQNVSLELVVPVNAAVPLGLTGQKGAAGPILVADATTASHDFAVRYCTEGTVTKKPATAALNRNT